MFSRLSPATCYRRTLRIQCLPKNAAARSIHLTCAAQNGPTRTCLLTIRQRPSISAVSFIRYASTNNDSPTDLLDHIPDAPPPPTLLQDAMEKVFEYHANGEPTLSSLGLGGYWPTGIVQSGFEYLHIGLDIPWWGAIVIGTVFIRLCLFPILVQQKKMAAKQIEYLPQFQKLQYELKEATMSGDIYEETRARHKYVTFMQEKNFNPFKALVPQLVQVVVMATNFFALNGMARLPVESLKEGGLWWFQNLTVYDPYYVLPLLTCVSLLGMLELNREYTHTFFSGKKIYIVRCLPFVTLLFTMHFPSAVVLYWSTNNIISLLQTGVFRIPQVRQALKVPEPKIVTKTSSFSTKGFVDDFKKTVDGYKLRKLISERERLDRLQFQQASRNAPPKTYKYDPTKKLKIVHAKVK